MTGGGVAFLVVQDGTNKVKNVLQKKREIKKFDNPLKKTGGEPRVLLLVAAPSTLRTHSDHTSNIKNDTIPLTKRRARSFSLGGYLYFFFPSPNSLHQTQSPPAVR